MAQAIKDLGVGLEKALRMRVNAGHGNPAGAGNLLSLFARVC
jgi:hypothetical protein